LNSGDAQIGGMLNGQCMITHSKSTIIVFASLFITLQVSAQTTQSGDLVQVISDIRDAMPGMGSNKFFIPTTAQLSAFDSIFQDLKSKNYSVISAKAAVYGYQFIKFIHTATGDTVYLLKETIPVVRGWGTYIYDPRASNDLTIEAPHPIWDTNTWELAIRLFVRIEAQWFILAGTHRYANSDSSSDMAHVTQSVFHTCHKRTGTSSAIQIHGFSKSNVGIPGYPDVVISNGTLNPPVILYTLKTDYEEKEFTAGVFSTATYSMLGNLGATTNKQGQWSNANGKLFVHIEHDYPLRTNAAKQAACIEAMYNTFTPPVSVQRGKVNPLEFEMLKAYPNPFNPTTTVAFNVMRAGTVRVKIIDLLGRDAGTITDGWLPSGKYTIPFSSGALSSGIYFCTLDTPLSHRIIKLFLLR
jgi:hypothetical protein